MVSGIWKPSWHVCAQNPHYTWLPKLFNIPNDAKKRRLFESLAAKRIRGFKTFLTNGWIYKKKKKKQKNKSCKGKDNEGGNDKVVEEEKLPWQIWPSVKEDEWNAFVLQRSKKKAVELLEQNMENALKKEYIHRVGAKTFGEWRVTWIKEKIYPILLKGLSNKPSNSTITTLLEYTIEVVQGKLVPNVEKDPFTLALGKAYHPGRVVGSGGTLLGWEKVMGSEYTKSGISRSSVNSPDDLDAKVASIKD